LEILARRIGDLELLPSAMHVGKRLEGADDLRLTLSPAGLDLDPVGWEFWIHGLGTRLGHIRLRSDEK
jgi:hypothetical protein